MNVQAQQFTWIIRGRSVSLGVACKANPRPVHVLHHRHQPAPATGWLFGILHLRLALGPSITLPFPCIAPVPPFGYVASGKTQHTKRAFQDDALPMLIPNRGFLVE